MIDRNKIDNLHKLPLEDVIVIINECMEAIGVVDLSTASDVLGVSKRRLYQMMNERNSVFIGIHKFPCVNLLIK